MPGMSELEEQITSSIVRSITDCAELCERTGAGYRAAFDEDNAAYLDRAAERWRQALDGARRAWADADRLETMRALAAADPNAETAACDAPTLVLEV